MNREKSKYMIFNFSRNYQFNTRLYIENTLLEQVTETRLLGVIIKDDLSWHANTENLVKRAYQRMMILKKLYSFNVPTENMVNIYVLYIRSVVEQSSVVWSSLITQGQEYELERVQKVALRIIFNGNYESYDDALNWSGLKTLKERRKDLSLTFAKKCTNHKETKNMFPLKIGNLKTRKNYVYGVTPARTTRLAKSAIPSMQRQLNQ